MDVTLVRSLALVLILLCLSLSYSYLNIQSEGILVEPNQETRTLRYKDLLYERASFEHDVVNCSVAVFGKEETEEFYRFLKESEGYERPCSPSVFKEYYRKENRFFGAGTWHVNIDKFPEKIDGDFYPEGCVFGGNVSKDASVLFNCLKRLNFKKILVTGDSNGNRYKEQLYYFLSNRSKSCELDSRGIQKRVRKNQRGDWDEYFRVPNKPFFWSRCGCSHCLAQTFVCKGFGPEDSDIVAEFIGMNSFIDSYVFFAEKQNDLELVLDTPTVIELLLRDYLPYRGFPDLWIVSPPLHHEAWSKDVVQFRENLTLFRRLLDHYLPPTTKVLLLADIRECPMYRLDIVQLFRRQLKTTRSRNEVFHAMNQVIFDTFRDHLLADDGQYLAFLDAGRILCPFTCSWHDDGGHMRPFVYEMFLKYIFEYLCAE